MSDWFTGVVEDINDPEKMNRVRVRMFGVHPLQQSATPTEDLPWATVMMPTTASGLSGIGTTPHGLLAGSWVVGFFRDGANAQDPLVVGSVASMYNERPAGETFKDVSDTYPKEEYIGEPDVNRLARSEDTETELIKTRNDTRTTTVSTANDAEIPWDEPESPYAAEYPHNKVNQTTSGHVFEIDDTPENERIHEYHTSGTFREIYPDGTVVTRIVGEDYLIVAKDNNVNIKGNVNLTIDQNCTTYIKGNWDIQVDKNMTMTIGGNQTISIAKEHNETVGGNSTTTVSKNFARNSNQHIEDNAPRIDHN